MLVKDCVTTIGGIRFFGAFLRWSALFYFQGGIKVDIYRVAFIGHRVIPHQYGLENKIEIIVRDMLREKEYVEFLVGRNGEFDIMAAAVVKRVRESVGSDNSSLILIQSYIMKDDKYYEKYYDGIEYPIDSNTHPKAAITARNRWMIENADVLVAYVEKDRKGGAYTAMKYMEKLQKKIVNLA